MPKQPKFKPVRRATGKTPWMISVPSAYSGNGERQRLFFATKALAEDAAGILREKVRTHGVQSCAISPRLAEDAAAAAAILPPGVTLREAAAYFVEAHDSRAKCPSMAEAWDAAIDGRPNHAPRTLDDLRKWQRKLPAWFMATNALDVTAPHIIEALTEVAPQGTHWKNGQRNISAVLGDLAKQGTIPTNPARAVHVARPVPTESDVVIYTPDELKALFAACVDYPTGHDKACSDCAVPFAFLAFSGVRADELTRLDWGDVSPELRNIRVGPAVAKRGRRRNARITDTLAAWIETIPEESRTGKIIPPRWRYKSARVRREAGIDGREKQDALRHSYGTYMLATENDLDALKADMGHEHVRVFFQHYYKAVTKRDAAPYWRILPAGVEAPALIQAV